MFMYQITFIRAHAKELPLTGDLSLKSKAGQVTVENKIVGSKTNKVPNCAFYFLATRAVFGWFGLGCFYQ